MLAIERRKRLRPKHLSLWSIRYDLLHTQGTEYVMDEIDGYISRRKKR